MSDWYQIVPPESTLMQGDVVFNCPRVVLPDDLTLDSVDRGDFEVDIIYTNAVIITQSCDIGSKEASEILLCPIYPFTSWLQTVDDYILNSAKGHNTKKIVEKAYENLRKGGYSAFHFLNKDNKVSFNDFQVVALNRPFSLNTAIVKQMLKGQQKIVRLNSPYREHLSQAYATLYMRVGLPTNIPRDLASPESYLPTTDFVEDAKKIVKAKEEAAEAKKKAEQASTAAS
ncbi:hypothetical protein [Hymenobacter sp. BT559]|uniref:hypothetical protein n=1 Tax=Hymenobacter sp. BT559 TaxID=2795729 RepID=UPI0018ED4414|nr:hypothetical protein [Hymenobacter sp. BT559]MBJ6145840.1 hypothetical protein [Hymenobacter sp. BT559]